MAKLRADQMLVDRGLVESRTRAQALIMAGLVFAGDRKVEKPGQALPEETVIDVRGRDDDLRILTADRVEQEREALDRDVACIGHGIVAR